jgi:hypothetical protein
MPNHRHTALVTGASAGIGEALACVFAANGFDVILTARREDRLETLANDIESRYGVSATVIREDLSDPEAPQRLFDEIKARGLQVDALVNNAGYGVRGGFSDNDWQVHADFMAVLSTSLLHLTHLFLPHMKEQKFGWILNVASLSGYMPGISSSASLYTPVKSFVVKFSQGLWTECRGTGVHVTGLCPGFTMSEFHDVIEEREAMNKLPGFMMMDAQTVARQGFEAVMRDKPVLINGWVNRVLAVLPRIIPETLLFGIIDWRRGGKM